MKKMLMLVLVLGMASLANATYTIGLVGSTITVSNDEALIGGINMGLAVIGSASFGTPTYRTVDAPVSAPIVNTYSGQDLIDAGDPYASWGFTGGWVNVTWGDPSLTPNGAGMWFTANVIGTPGTLIALTDDQGVVFGGQGQSVTIPQVPEPITMALLGLGGLFLRRRK